MKIRNLAALLSITLFFLYSCSKANAGDQQNTQQPQKQAVQEQTLKQKLSIVEPSTKPLPALSENDAVNAIRKKYSAVNGSVNASTALSYMDESDHIALNVEGFVKDGYINKITTSSYIEGRTFETEYYFHQGKLFFVFSNSGYIGSSQRDEDRYYFHNDKIIRWLNSDKKKVSSAKFPTSEKSILAAVSSLYNGLLNEGRITRGPIITSEDVYSIYWKGSLDQYADAAVGTISDIGNYSFLLSIIEGGNEYIKGTIEIVANDPLPKGISNGSKVAALFSQGEGGNYYLDDIKKL